MRQDFEYLYSFNNPNELELTTTLLRANNIESRIEDEFVTQTMNVLATGYSGGARLFVRNEDGEQAKILLADIGIDLEENPENQEFEFITRLKQETGKIPFLNRLPQVYQVPVLRTLLISLLTVGIAFAVFPSNEERLTKEAWCFKQLTYRGEIIKVESTGARIVIIGGWNLGPPCKESISFSKDGWSNRVSLPGINSPGDYGKWEWKNGKILISNIEETVLQQVFEGEFAF